MTVKKFDSCHYATSCHIVLPNRDTVNSTVLTLTFVENFIEGSKKGVGDGRVWIETLFRFELILTMSNSRSKKLVYAEGLESQSILQAKVNQFFFVVRVRTPKMKPALPTDSEPA